MTNLSQIPFRSTADDAGRVPALAHARVAASSAGLGWRGLYLESGQNQGWTVDDLTVEGHYVALNLADVALDFQQRVGHRWAPVSIPPGTFWINPEGQPFSLRVRMTAHWAGAVVPGEFLDEVMGRHHELRGGFGVPDELLAHLIRALLTEAAGGGATGPAFARSLIHAFVLALGARHGVPAAELPARGGIAPGQLRRLLAWIDARLGEDLTVEAMADQVGLSVAHFSREFKRSTGETPWGHVVSRRLEDARARLSRGEPLSAVASECGFSDQAHLSRLFKQRYGSTPGAFLRRSQVN